MGTEDNDHAARAIKLSHAWAASCTCGWLGADYRKQAQATKQALEHEQDPSPPELLPWGEREH